MKKLLALLLALLMVCGLAGCGGGKEAKAPEKITFDDMSVMSIRNSETGDTLTLGMSRGVIEDMIGVGKEKMADFYVYGDEENSMCIEYTGEVASMFYLEGDNPWRIKHGISSEDTTEDLFRYYGEEEIKEYKNEEYDIHTFFVRYYFDENDDRVADASSSSKNYAFDMFVQLKDVDGKIKGINITVAR